MKYIAVSLNIIDISVSMKPSQGLKITPPNIINTVLGIKANILTEDKIIRLLTVRILSIIMILSYIRLSYYFLLGDIELWQIRRES
ncbi:hypothetical protein [Clostridium paridis]|uniref:Uncharacterized protein n=1 Tax=Clostridium paridis TaxID=2803863 RepID=A0A937FCR4_9CLOT|nr:hypothetical protein [Clostridium paridis]MBL4930400.1 hypothetical protein [Clostridium paridis]